MATQNPSKWAIKFLQWFVPKELEEAILGDLLEQYDLHAADNPKKANRIFVWNVLRFFRPGILLRNKLKINIFNKVMILNNLKISYRSLIRSRLYSIINSMGLAIAIAFSVLIYFYIQDENSFDKWHNNKDRIYRINNVSYTDRWKMYDGDKDEIRRGYLQTALGPVLKDEAPEVERFTRFNSGSESILQLDEVSIKVSLTFVDNDFFKIFDFDILSGNKNTLLSEESNVVISREIAENHFPDIDPVGKSINLNLFGEDKLFTISGIIENAPDNTSIYYRDILLSSTVRPFYKSNYENWRSLNTPLFVQLGENNTKDQLLESLKEVHKKYIEPGDLENMDEEEKKQHLADARPRYEAKQIQEIHFDEDVSWTRVSSIQYSIILTGIGLLILIIACINYVTLAISNSESKKKEVGIRKAMGGTPGAIFTRFMSESLLLSLFSAVLAFFLLIVFTPYFNEFTGKSFSVTNYIFELIAVLLSTAVIIGILAGLYPSLIISRLRTLLILKIGGSSRFSTRITTPLVVFQFVISCFLIICSAIMLSQMKFITTKDLGYNKEQVIVLPTFTGFDNEGEQLLDKFKLEARQSPGIISVAGTSTAFTQGSNVNAYEIDGEVHAAFNYRVDPNYIDVLGIELKEGRNFDEEIISDYKKTIIVNESLVEDMGWNNPLDERLRWTSDSIGWKVIGVVKDYHFLSLENKIEPMFIYLDNSMNKIHDILIKIDRNNIPNSVSQLENIWKKVSPDKPFDYTFLDEDVDRQYKSYSKWTNIMSLATGFAIFVACLGLFGLAGINALNKTKEIGIRKAMGAEVKDIILLMTKPFVIMALISFALASPASYYAMQNWLGEFEFAIGIGWEIFMAAFAGIVTLAMLTVSYHTIRTAHLNPADTLKHE